MVSNEPAHIGDQRRLRQSRQSLRCSHTWSMEADKGSDKKQTSEAHACLKNEFTEDRKYHNLRSRLKYNTTQAESQEQGHRRRSGPLFLAEDSIGHTFFFFFFFWHFLLYRTAVIKSVDMFVYSKRCENNSGHNSCQNNAILQPTPAS